MKLNLTGPQAITIFPVKSMDGIPSTAKTSSFATPQGYVCADTGHMLMYIKGHEYKFVSHEHHEEELAKAMEGHAVEGMHCDSNEHTVIHDRLEKLDECVKSMEHDVHMLMHTLYHPLKVAMAEVEHKE